MSDREIVGAELIAPGLNVSRSIALKIVKKGELKVCKYGGDNSSPLCRRQSDIEAFKRKKRGG